MNRKIAKRISLVLCMLLLVINVSANNKTYKNEVFCIDSNIEGTAVKAGENFVLKINMKNISKVNTKGTFSLREVGENKTNKFFEGGQDQQFNLDPEKTSTFYYELKANENLGNTSYPITLSVKVNDMELVDRIMVPVISESSTILPSSPDGEDGKTDILAQLPSMPKDVKDAMMKEEKPAEPTPEKPKDDTQTEPKPSVPNNSNNPSTGGTPNIDSYPGGSNQGPDMSALQDVPMVPSVPMMASGGDLSGGDLGGYSGVNGGSDQGVSLSGDNVKNKPKLIIDKYSFEPSYPLAGEEFKMNLSFFNTNNDKGVRNIKIFLTSNEVPASSDPNGAGAGAAAGSSVFTPVGSSNTFYIDYIDPKGTINKSVVLTTAPTIESKNYTLIANFEYEDKDGNQYTAQELIGIPIIQESKLTTSKVTINGEGFIGNPVDGEIQFYNTGKDTLFNLMVSVEGDFKDKSLEEYIGNFKSGDSSSYMFNITPEKSGSQKGKIIFKYEDATGKSRSIEEEFVLDVSDEEYVDPNMTPEVTDETMNEGKSISPLMIGGIIIVGIALIAAILQRKKRKNQEKEMTIDED